MKNAIFMDRDGVICEEKNLFYRGIPITKPEDFKWIAEAKEAFSFLSQLENFLLVVITNQSLINRGILGVEEFHKINRPIYEELKKYNRILDGFYFCPHTPEERCNCRKPKIEMILQAKRELDIDLKKSYFIGDKTTDIKAGKDAGCKTVLIRTGYGGKDDKLKIKPDFIINNLIEMKSILERENYGNLF